MEYHNLALQAIANMEEMPWSAERSSLCVAVARISLERAGATTIQTEALEIIAGKRQCADNLMSHQAVARAALNG